MPMREKYIRMSMCATLKYTETGYAKQPTADVVEVVRCKDCKYFYQNGNIKVCKHWNCHSTTYDGYCSYGERRK